MHSGNQKNQRLLAGHAVTLDLSLTHRTATETPTPRAKNGRNEELPVPDALARFSVAQKTKGTKS
jgi:hypothetical protein